MNLSLTLPGHIFEAPCHDPRFNQLGDEIKRSLTQRLAAMQEIAASAKKAKAIRDLANRRKGERGWGEGTLINLWYKFLKTRDWYCLLDKSQAGKAHWNCEDSLPEAFLEYVAQQWALRQRDKFRAAWIDLKSQYERWQSGDDEAAIPGYFSCPKADPRTQLPVGWTYENLLRLAKKHSSRYARKLIQIGPKAAQNEFTYKVPTTRAGIEVGQVFLFDDSWNDFRVIYRGKGSRILSLHALDLASGCACLAGHKPTVEDERGVEQRLKEREMVFLVAALLSTIGYRADGTTFVCEKGAATIRSTEETMLDSITGGKIRVQTGPAGGGPGIAGLMAGRSGGNPRWKAPIESFFNLLRNRTDHLLEFPGQLGSNSRLNCPEGTARLEAADEALARAIQLLTPERQQLIRFNLLQYENALPVLGSRIEFCNTRRDHDLEGWRESGHFTPAFRLSDQLPFLPFSLIEQLRPEAKEQLRIMLAANPDLTGEIQLSPREVFDAGLTKLKRFTPPQTALLLAETEGREEPVKKGIIELEFAEVDPCKKLAYGPTIRDCQGREEQMGSDDKFLVRVNPFAPERAYLYDAKGGFVGIAQSRGRVGTRLDVEATTEHFKAKAAQVSAWTAEARQLAAPISQRADEIATTNARVIKQQQEDENDLAAAADAALLRSQT